MASAGVSDLTDRAIDTRGQQLLSPVPLPGKLVYVLGSPQLDQGTVAGGATAASSLIELDLATGTTTTLGPEQAGWSIAAVTAHGTRLLWVETQRGDDSSCVDASFGCARWALWIRDLASAGSSATEVAHEDQYVPLRGVPLEPRLSDSTACWAESADSKTWTIWRSTVNSPHAQPMRVASLPTWVRRCQDVNGTVLAITWDMSSGNGQGNLVTVSAAGPRMIVPGAQDFAARGTHLLYTTLQPSGVSRALWTTTLSNPKAATSLSEQDDIPAFGWVGSHVWLATTTGLLLTDPSAGAPQTPLTESGQQFRAPSSNGDILTWVPQKDDPGSTIRIATVG
jgi:hypothetical protein